MFRRFCAAVLALLFLFGASPLPSSASDAGLKEGDRGKEVLALKIRLFDLGYYKSVKDAHDRYTDNTAGKMLAMGAWEALNLDGGGTTALIFLGELLNRPEKDQTSRAVSGLIAFR